MQPIRFFQMTHITSAFFTFAVLYFVVVMMTSLALQLVGIIGFASMPYIKMTSLAFTGAFFLRFFLHLDLFVTVPIRWMRESGLVALWLLISIFSLMVGMAFSNPVVYLVTDFVYIFLGYLLFCIGWHLQRAAVQRYGDDREAQLRFMQKIAGMLAVLAVVFLVVSRKIPPSMAMVMLALGFVFLVMRRWRYAAMLYLPVIAQIPFSNRALLLSVLLCMALYVFRFTGRKQTVVRHLVLLLLAAMGLIVLYGVMMVILQLLPPESPMYFRINQLMLVFTEGLDFERSDMTSLAQRIVEAKLVLDGWLSSPLTFFFSTGLGSVVDGSLLIDASVTGAALLGSDNVHNIHILPFALIHKYGVFGIVLFLLLLKHWFAAFNHILNARQESVPLLFLCANVFYCLWFVYSLPASNYLWSVPLFWLCLSLKMVPPPYPSQERTS